MDRRPDPEFWQSRPVTVIGGTGFLGLQIVKQLVALNAKVTSISLPLAPDHPIHELSSVEVRVADMKDRMASKTALDGADVIFQAAGPVGVGKAGRHGVMNEHADMTRILLNTKPIHSTLIHTSSIVAVGATTTGDILDEASPFPLEKFAVEYVRGKHEAEKVALSGEQTVVVNPGYLFGPEDFGPSVMGDFCHRYWRGRIPGSPGGGISAVDVRDVATGHLLAAEHGQKGQRYILAGENVSYRTLLQKLAEVAGYHPRFTPHTPTWFMTTLAAGAELRSKMTGKTPFPSFEHARLNPYFWFVSSAKAERELGFRARPILDTLSDAFAWHAARSTYRMRGFNQWWFRQAA